MPDLFAQKYFGEVRDTPELRRVLGLPRRRIDDWAKLHQELERLLKRPGGKMSLRKEQALALFEIGTVGGLFGPLRVGSGKTLISLLAPVVAFSSRPLLLVPAKLLAKTQRDRRVLSEHWDIPDIRMLSYEWLGRAQAAEILHKYQPDLIIADECHKLKNKSAAVTRRVHRWFRSSKTKCVAMSGTITKRSIHDYDHILQWIYDPDDYPLPKTWTERTIWADAIDARKNQQLAHPGALKFFCNEEESKIWKHDQRRAARQAYRRHLVNTPAVVATNETPIDASLVIQSTEAKVSHLTEQAFKNLRNQWETPDGWPLSDGLEMFRHARELALGFFYKWDPRPPPDWLEARKNWCAFVRSKIKRSNTLDSELQVRRAFPNQKELVQWLTVKKTFIPNTVPVWIDDYLIEFVSRWAKENRGIIWVEHRSVGQRLEKETGLVYYGRRGLSSEKRPIEDHPKNQSMLASIASNSEGRNLQAWHKNLILSVPPNGAQHEQLYGRTHRDGQQEDEVSVDVLMTCTEHVTAFHQAQKDAEYIQDSTGSPQKLLLADITVLEIDDILKRTQPRWMI